MPLPPFKLPFPSKDEHNKDPGITSLLQKKKNKKEREREKGSRHLRPSVEEPSP